jgi:hypothetical protein
MPEPGAVNVDPSLCFHDGNCRVLDMETYGQASPQEAAAALEAAQRSRARVAWSGYPWWYWVATGAGLGAMAYAVALPGWWVLAFAAVVAPALYAVAHAACRARGVCEGWSGAMTPRDTAVLYGPEILLMLAGAPVSKHVWWSSIAVAVLVSAVFAGTGLARGARAARCS